MPILDLGGVPEKSKLQLFAEMPPALRSRTLERMTLEQKRRFLHLCRWSWDYRGRPSQQFPSGDWWDTVIYMAGRGWGKTATGTQNVKRAVYAGVPHVDIIVPTYADIEKTLLAGEAGLLKGLPSEVRPTWKGQKNFFEWPNGAVTFVFTAEEPERLRGPEHGLVWWDEMAACRYQQDVYDQMMMGLRLGQHPRLMVTTTPRPTALVRKLMNDPATLVVRGSTYDNSANLAPSFLKALRQKYEGTRLGRQEIFAEILDDNPGALFKRAKIDEERLSPAAMQKIDLYYVVVGVDPAVTSGEESDETGIVVAGVDEQDPPHFYILDDRSMRGRPQEWGEASIAAYHASEANIIIGEVNNGGDLIERNIHACASDIPFESVRASRGKAIRAEPISALYEQGRVHHVGTFPALEDQMCSWDPSDKSAKSPDRMDALVWALTRLEQGGEPQWSF